jgi:sulfopropanediol 3-dehydrogenase
MLAVADEIASEHVQVMTDRDDFFLKSMTRYGDLFWGRAPMVQMAIR